MAAGFAGGMALPLRRAGVFVPATSNKKSHERKLTVPPVWNEYAVYSVFGSEAVEVEFPVNPPFFISVFVRATDYNNPCVPVNARATFLCNTKIYGDAFFVMKQVDVNKVLLLDFTMKDFENLLVSVLKVRNNVSIPITRPDFFEQDVEDEGNNSESEIDPELIELSRLRLLPMHPIQWALSPESASSAFPSASSSETGVGPQSMQISSPVSSPIHTFHEPYGAFGAPPQGNFVMPPAMSPSSSTAFPSAGQFPPSSFASPPAQFTAGQHPAGGGFAQQGGFGPSAGGVAPHIQHYYAHLSGQQ